MARKPKSTAGAAQAQHQTAGGTVTQDQLEAVRNQPEVHAAVTTLQPFSTGVLGLVKMLTVRNEMERHVMADLLRQIKTAQATVDDKFGAITKPMWQAWRAVKDWQAQTAEPLAQAEAEAKEKLGEYALGVERERRRVEGEREAAARLEQEQMREREQRERQYPQPQPVWPLVDYPQAPAQFIAMRAPGHNPGPYPTAANPTAQWESAPTITPTAPPLAPLAGITTTLGWAVEIDDENAAVGALITAGLWDLRTQLGVAGAFVRLDASALNIAVHGDGEVAQVVRGVLGQVPGLRVVERATTRSRRYE